MHKKYSSFTVIITLLLCLFTTGESNATEQEYHLLATTFPIYQLTRNVTDRIPAIALELMLPAELGCPHDYALTPRDMRKIARADILITNGLGMEEFLGAPVEKANSNLQIIDSSAGITDLIEFTEQDNSTEQHKEAEMHTAHSHEHHGINPHLFVSPKLNIKLAYNIADQLGQIIPRYKEQFKANADRYAETLTELLRKITTFSTAKINKLIIQPHGVFDYLARDLNFEIMATLQPHGQNPAAGQIIKIIRLIKSKNIGLILTEPQYSSDTASLLAREAAIKILQLDPGATGSENAPLDYYNQIMLENLRLLQQNTGE